MRSYPTEHLLGRAIEVAHGVGVLVGVGAVEIHAADRVAPALLVGVVVAAVDRVGLQEAARRRVVEPDSHEGDVAERAARPLVGTEPAVSGEGRPVEPVAVLVIVLDRRCDRRVQRQPNRDVPVQVGQLQDGVPGGARRCPETSHQVGDVAGDGTRGALRPGRAVARGAVVVGDSRAGGPSAIGPLCLRRAQAAPGSPCRSRSGAVADAYHTGRFTKAPRLARLLRAPTLADRGRGRP
ncbi:zinc finger domain-containing protein [Streptomyces niveus]